jgi:hypothetical protein
VILMRGKASIIWEELSIGLVPVDVCNREISMEKITEAEHSLKKV